MAVLYEVCCGSADDALQAAAGGADRVELNSALFLGGLTPSLGALQVTKERSDVRVICMVRPREGGFCYSETEYAAMLADAGRYLRRERTVWRSVFCMPMVPSMKRVPVNLSLCAGKRKPCSTVRSM